MRYRTFFCLAVSASLGLAATAHAQGLRYSWKPGETCTYRVRFETVEPTYLDRLDGKLGYTVQADGDSFSVSPTGTLTGRQSDKDGRPLDQSQPSRLAHLGVGAPTAQPAAKLDASGSWTAGAGKPYAIADPVRLLVMPLSLDGKTTWEADGDCVIPLYNGQTNTGSLPAHEHLTVTLNGDTTSDPVFQAHYELKATQKVNGAPRVQLTLDGPVTFDRRQGLPRSASLKGNLVTTSLKGSDSVPVELHTRLLEKPLAAPRPDAQTLTDQERDSLILDLSSPDHNRRNGAAQRLQAVNADDDASEVVDALLPLLQDPDLFTRWKAVDALKVWGTADAIPALIRTLVDQEHAVRWADLEALAALKDGRAAVPLAARLDSPDRGFAGEALRKFGPACETAVIPYLRDPAWEVRLEACKVLQVVGAKKSLQALQALYNDANGIVKMGAGDAWKAIQDRLNAGA